MDGQLLGNRKPADKSSDTDPKLELLDLEDILRLSGTSSQEFGFYHLNAERNLALGKLGLDNQTSGIPQDHSEFLRKVDQVRAPAQKSTHNLNLLSRGKLINLDSLNLRTSTTQSQQSPAVRTAGDSIYLQRSQSGIFTELSEQIEMATADKDLVSEPELSSSSDGEDKEPTLESVDQQGSQPHVVGLEETSELTASASSGFPTRSPSNLDISHLYSSTSIPAVEHIPSVERPKVKKHVTIQKVTTDISQRAIPRLSIGEDTPTISTTTTDRNGDALRDITLTGFGSLASMISDLHEGQSKMLLLMGTLAGKLDSIESRMSEMELSLSILKGAVGTMDADVKNLLQKQLTPMVQTSLASATHVEPTRSASLQAESNPLEEDQKEVEKAKHHYKEYLSGLKMKHLEEQTFIQAHLMGGLKAYFAKTYPGRNGMEYQLELAQLGDARGEHFMAIDRALMRLRSSLHKPVYLPVDPTVPIYPGITSSSLVEAPPQPTGVAAPTIDPKSLYTHIRAIYK